MKPKLAIVLIGAVLLLTACPEKSYKTDLKKLQNNHMDFPDLQKEYYNGIHYQLSKLFQTEYSNNFVLTDNAQVRSIHGLDLYYSVEEFDEDDADLIRYTFDDEISRLDAVHDNYVLKRIASLQESSASIKKHLPKNVSFPGYIQIIHGKVNSYDDEVTYFTATMEIDNECYVFQLIGKGANMGYLYDDFLAILVSVEK